MLEALLVSTSVVALAEIGDKTQLLALMLAARFRRPLPIVLGIFASTVFNHALAGAVGIWVANALGPLLMRWILGLSFLVMAVWVLIPDHLDGAETRDHRGNLGIFAATFVAFFLAEMGDKTQIATIALAARYQALVAVVAGSTLGMLIANVPAVLLGGAAARKLPARALHVIAALIFAALGIAALAGWGSGLLDYQNRS
jgi:putative Ca2+/H+ antiporter (TMEM165/GDT1 family)